MSIKAFEQPQSIDKKDSIENTNIKNMESFLLKNKEIFKTHSYLNELAACHLYESITGILPVETSGLEYTRKVFSFIKENNKDFNFKLVTLYSWQTEVYDSDLDFQGRKDTAMNYWFWSVQLDILLKLTLNSNNVEVSLASSHIENVNKFLDRIKDYKYVRIKNEIGVIYNGGGALNIKKVPIDSMDIDLELNYGKDFIKKHEIILDKLKNKNSGLYIFSGAPSGGKTSYIKHLAEIVKERLFLYIPVSFIDSITSPDLIGLLLKYPKSVLILEDAEKAVVSRESSDNPGLVSTLLNLSDGIMSSILGLSVIVTFNTNKNDIDKALLRKGRLFAEHHFEELSVENCNRLAAKLNKKITFDKPTMLGEVYNADESNFHEEKESPVLGFR